VASTKRRQRQKFEKKQRQKERKREAYIAANLPQHLELLRDQNTLMAELKQAAEK